MLETINSRKLKIIGNTIGNKKWQLLNYAVKGKVERITNRGRLQISYIDNISSMTG